MARQTPGQRWCSLVLLAVFVSLILFYGLPAIGYRMGRAIEAGRHDEALQAAPVPAADTLRDDRAARFARATRDVRPAVVRVEALVPDTAAANSPVNGIQQAHVLRGCGVVFDREGFVITSRRVVSGAVGVHVLLARHRQPFPAMIAGSDAGTDLAVLKFDPPSEGVPAAELADVENPETGEFVTAIGNAYRPGEFLWVAQVNSCGRAAPPAACDLSDFIETLAGNPWNCGGPLVNLRGEIVGITASLREADGLPVGIAVPVFTVRRVVEQLRLSGRVSRGWLGVFIHKISPAAEMDLPQGGAAFTVDYVVPDSPADRGGIRAGDVIVSIDGAPLSSGPELRKRIAAVASESEVVVSVSREGTIRETKVIVLPHPATPPALPGEREWGVRLADYLSPEESKRWTLDQSPGVVVEDIAPGNRLTDLAANDVIVSVNGVPTPNLAIFCREVSRLQDAPAKNTVNLAVSSRSGRRVVEVGAVPGGTH